MSYYNLFLGLGLAAVIGYGLLDYFLLRRGYDLSGTLKSFWGGIGLLIIPLLVSSMTYSDVKNYYELKQYGVKTEGKVIESKQEVRRSRRRTYVSHVNVIQYDEHRRRFSLDKEYPQGTTMPLFYSRRNPSITKLGELPASLSDVVMGGVSPWILVVGCVLLTGCLVGSFLCFKDGVASFRIGSARPGNTA